MENSLSQKHNTPNSQEFDQGLDSQSFFILEEKNRQLTETAKQFIMKRMMEVL